MHKSVAAAVVASILMPAGLLLAQTAPKPLPPRPGEFRPVNASTTRPVPPPPPRPFDGKFASTSHEFADEHMGTSSLDHEYGSSTASTTPPRPKPAKYRPVEVRSFLKWLYALPASTTVGELRDRIDVSILNNPNAKNGASANAPLQSMDIISGLFDFFGLLR